MLEIKEIQEARALIDRLPDTYAKATSSRLFRLFRIIGAEFAQVRDALTTTEAYRDVDQAAGATLDRLGANVGQERGQVSDYTYRGLIKGKIARNLSPGDVDSIKRIVSVMLSIPVSEVSVTPYWQRVEQEPAAIEIAAPCTRWPKAAAPGGRLSVIIAAGVRARCYSAGRFSSVPSAESQYAAEGLCRLRADHRRSVRRLLRCAHTRTAHKDEVR